jgi:predicted transcriptional regulator
MFTTEKQLVDSLKANYASICDWKTKTSNTGVLEEVDLGFGVADLVIAKLQKQTAQTTEKLTYFDTIIYRIIQANKTVTLNQLKEITKADTVSLNKSINKLIKDSYINKTDSLIKFRKSYKGISTNTIAIEAKLKNWKRALNQAFRYKWFAEKSIVVLDSHYINPALKNIQEFKQLNVGLAEINNTGKIILHFNPLKSNPVDMKMWILLNETLKNNLLRKKK